VPGLSNVMLLDVPVPNRPVSNEPFAAVAESFLAPSFFQVTVGLPNRHRLRPELEVLHRNHQRGARQGWWGGLRRSARRGRGGLGRLRCGSLVDLEGFESGGMIPRPEWHRIGI
jgi:hypothetical protein